MRLLDTEAFLDGASDRPIYHWFIEPFPKYAILSHTWYEIQNQPPFSRRLMNI
jgi:hypothetical protein